MKHVAIVLAVVFAASFAYGQAATQPGQSATPSAPSASTQAPSAQPATPGATAQPSAPAGTMGRMTADQFKSHLQQSGITGPQALEIEYIWLAQVQPFDVGHVLAVKDDLKLTDDQINKLTELMQKSQDDVRAVLNDDQKRLIQQIKPMTVADSMAQLPPSVHSMLMAQAGGHAAAGTPGATMAPGAPSSSEYPSAGNSSSTER